MIGDDDDDDDRDDDPFHLYRSGDPETSRLAAERIWGDTPRLQRIVLHWAAQQTTPWHDKLLVKAMADLGEQSTWRTRRAELTRKGLIAYAGYDHIDEKNGRHQCWHITAMGLDVVNGGGEL